MAMHEEPAPEGLWEAIDQRITAGNMPPKKTVVTRRLWGWRLGAVAAAALLLLLLVRYRDTEKPAENVFTGNELPVHPENGEPVRDQLTVANQQNVSPPSISPESRPVQKKRPSVVDPQTLLVASRNEEITDVRRENENISDSPAEGVSDAEDMDEKKAPVSEPLKDDDLLLAMNDGGDLPKRPKWETGLTASNFAGGASETYSGYGTLALTETVEEQYHFLANDTWEPAYTDVRHHQPIKFGLTFRYNINQRWSLMSGLTYSKLSSELQSGSGNYYYDDKQTLHFIGVPVNLAYTFWQSPNISAYLSTGALVEKNVAGRLNSNYYIDNQLETTTREKISMNQLQWSANAAIGLGYRISNHVGLYAEPGISYYFRNGSQLETIYSDNPFIFNLQVGLRFTLGE